ncbi:hypothetical protein TWF481_008767 [Arthrobotrys musiformis]|uniref:Uncharacterized protein n=1 Tax=Arthrobotrys musiformis TaxID=47236 RepID=A0AAV9W927_9PEZI
MQRPQNIRSLCILTAWFLLTPCHAFYRLWGYSDLRRNLENNKLFKAQSSLLTRGGQTNQKPLCHSFPDPGDTELSVLRVVGVMNHPSLANPIQALGLWEEKGFNCEPFLPRLVIYFQPGHETQIIDLRPFGGEWVYSNWKQIIPGDRHWNAFIEPELTGEKKLGDGFVKKITRKESDHNFAEGTNIVWDTQAPDNSWIIDKRPGILQRDASKTGFESRFKLELGTLLLQEESEPLGEKEAARLAAELATMKRALADQYARWQMGRVDFNRKSAQGIFGQSDDQFPRNMKPDNVVYMEPYMVQGYGSEGQQSGQGYIGQQSQGGQQGQREQQIPVEEQIPRGDEEVKILQLIGEDDDDGGTIKQEDAKVEAKEEVTDPTNLGMQNQPGFLPPNTSRGTAYTGLGSGQGYINPGFLNYQAPDISAYMKNLYTFNQRRNLLASLVQNSNPFYNNRVPGPSLYTNRNPPWTPSFEEMILLRQQELLRDEAILARQALERELVQNRVIPIRPRPQPIDAIPKQIRDLNRLNPLAIIQNAHTPAPVNMKRILPPAEDVLYLVEDEELRKAFRPNPIPPKPIELQDEEQGGGGEQTQANAGQDAHNFMLGFFERSRKGDNRKSRDI